MFNVKRTITGIAVACMLVMATVITVMAATASTSFDYAGKTINCSLTADWSNNKGTSKTYINGGSGSNPLGAYCNAYKGGPLKKGEHVIAFDLAQVSTTYKNVDEFRSVHNIQDSDRTPLKSAKLTLTK